MNEEEIIIFVNKYMLCFYLINYYVMRKEFKIL